MRRYLHVLAVAGVLFGGPRGVCSDHAPPPRAAENEPLVALMDNLGDHAMPVTTSNPRAQQYFNQGLRLVYAFNHDEAIRAFQAAARLDPQCAMAHWGIALALGTNYNMPMDEEQGKAAYAAMQQALALSKNATPREQAYIRALRPRYADPAPEERQPLDEAYAAAMARLVEQYPDDWDAATLYAESLMNLRPWKLWTADGKPEPGTEQILATLERVLANAPDHPGANHYYIHAVEEAIPEKGIAAAERLGALAPGAGHLVHMPAHIFFRVGRYRDAALANEAAIRADEAYIAAFKPTGVYPMMYYPHNIHFLWAARMMEGRSQDAIAAATEVTRKMPDAMVKEMPMLEGFTPTRLFALARFEKWDDVLNEPAPDAELKYASGMRHYARGLAQLGKQHADAARHEADLLRQIAAAVPPDQEVMQHSAADLLAIAQLHLDSALLEHDGKLHEAERKLRDAVSRQDALRYDEPPPWYLPMRQPLGALLLKADRPAAAEAVFQADLKHYPENGYALRGLEKSLRAQDRHEEADQVHRRFERAWANADFKLP